MVDQEVIKGSALPEASIINDSDAVVVVQSGTTKRAPASLLGTLAGLSWVQGGWSAVVEYVPAQALQHNGNSYFCNVTNTNKEPGVAADWEDYWELLAASGEKGVAGIRYQWDTGTIVADPGTGRIRGNNAVPGSITILCINKYIAETGNPSLENLLARLDDSTSTSDRGTIIVQNIASPAEFLAFKITGTLTDGGDWIQVPVAFLDPAGASTISNDTYTAFQFFQTGEKGAQGIQGTQGIQGNKGDAGQDGVTAGYDFTFSTSNSMADPGIGKLAFNNSSFPSITALAISAQASITGNPDVSPVVAGWGDSTTVSDRARLLIKKKSAPENQIELKINGTVTDNTSWLQIPAIHVNSIGTFAADDELVVEFYRTGNSGAGTGDVVGPASAVTGRRAAFDGTSGKLLKDAGAIVGSELQVSAANKLWVSDGVNSFTERDITTNALSLLAAANYAAMRTLLDLEAGTDFLALSNFSANGQSLVGAADYAAMRTLLSLGTAALKNTGTSGDAVPLLNTLNSWPPQGGVAAALTTAVGGNFSANAILTVDASGGSFTVANPGTDPGADTLLLMLVTCAASTSVGFGSDFTNIDPLGYTPSNVAGAIDALWWLFKSSSGKYGLCNFTKNIFEA